MLTRRTLLTAATALGAAGWASGAEAQNARDATLRIAWPYDTSSLDAVGIGVQRSTWGVSIHLYDRLVTYATSDGPDGTRKYDPNKIAPELAESWEVSPDSKTITFRLRRNATFHDGSPVTAEDVRWSIARALSVPAAAGVMRIGGVSSQDQLSAVDDHTFRVTLSEPNRYSISAFTIPFAAIINKKLALANATAQDPWANEWLKRNAAGGGAYQLGSFRPDQVALTRFENWVSGPKPAIQQIVFQTVPEASARTALVERNSVDIAIEIPPNDFDAVAQRGVARAVAIPMPNHMDFLAFNSQAAPFNDVRVRQAIAYALPHEQIFKGVFRGRGVPLYGRSGEVQPGVFPQAHAFKTDVEKAKALLREAGLTSGLQTSIAYSIGKASYFDPLALVIRDELGKIGINVEIQRLPGAQFDERVAARSLPMLLDNRVAWLSQPDYWLKVFYTGPGTSNLGNFQSPKLEAMLKDLKGDASEQSYAQQTGDMTKLVLEEIPMLPLRQGAFELIMTKALKGYTYSFHGLPDARSLTRA